MMTVNEKICYLCFDLLGKETDNSKVETIKVMALQIFLAIFLQRTRSSSYLSLSLTCLGGREISINQCVRLLAPIVIAICDWR